VKKAHDITDEWLTQALQEGLADEQWIIPLPGEDYGIDSSDLSTCSSDTASSSDVEGTSVVAT
jgi:hypothetical protein